MYTLATKPSRSLGHQIPPNAWQHDIFWADRCHSLSRRRCRVKAKIPVAPRGKPADPSNVGSTKDEVPGACVCMSRCMHACTSICA